MQGDEQDKAVFLPFRKSFWAMRSEKGISPVQPALSVWAKPPKLFTVGKFLHVRDRVYLKIQPTVQQSAIV